jgi:hypothetical protein
MSLVIVNYFELVLIILLQKFLLIVDLQMLSGKLRFFHLLLNFQKISLKLLHKFSDCFFIRGFYVSDATFVCLF